MSDQDLLEGEINIQSEEKIISDQNDQHGEQQLTSSSSNQLIRIDQSDEMDNSILQTLQIIRKYYTSSGQPLTSNKGESILSTNNEDVMSFLLDLSGQFYKYPTLNPRSELANINLHQFEGMGDELYARLSQFCLQYKHDTSISSVRMLQLHPSDKIDLIRPIGNGEIKMLETEDPSVFESYEINGVSEFPAEYTFGRSNDIRIPAESKDGKRRYPEDERKIGKIWSENKKDYIEWELVNDQFVQIISYQFQYSRNSSISRTIYLRRRATDHLFIIDEEKFIAEVEIDYVNKSKFFEAKTFQCKAKIIQSLTKVNRIIDDNGSAIRNKAYGELINFVKVISQRTTQNIDFAEDFFQFSFFRKAYDLIGFLSDIIRNEYISRQFKNIVQNFLKSYNSLSYRSEIQMFRLFTDNNAIVKTLFNEFLVIYKEGVNQHRKSLKGYSNLTNDMINDLNEISDSQIFQLSNVDVKLFADLLIVTSQHEHPTIDVCATKSIKILWNKLMKKVKGNPFFNFFSSMKTLSDSVPLTNSIYLYLFKSALDLLEEISKITNIPIEKIVEISDPGKLTLIKDIVWPVECANSQSLNKQFSVVLNAMNHFVPGCYSKNNVFDHKLRNNSNLAILSDERKIWYYILHDTLWDIFDNQKNSSEKFRQFLNNLLDGYRNILRKSTDDRFESFRVCGHSIVKFATQTCSYFFNITSKYEKFDQIILKKQIELITNLKDDSNYLQNFMNVIDIFQDYWQLRVSFIDKIPDKYPYVEFELILNEICDKLLTIVTNAFAKTMNTLCLVNFFRVFNEFLKFFESLDMPWLINENNSTLDSQLFNTLNSLKLVNLINDRKKSYQVLNPKLFIEIIKYQDVKIVPKHYILEVVKCLLDITIDLLTNPNHDLNAVSDLMHAIAHSFTYFKDQNEYLDYDIFFVDSTKPFANVIKNCHNYAYFKRRLDNIEKFYVYSRKLDEIDLIKALDLYEQEMMELSECGFKTQFDRTILLSCCEIYEKQFDLYAEMGDIDKIIADTSTYIPLTPKDLTEWTSDFKQNVIPLILAAVSAVWSILESVDISCTKKSIKPYYIQILCILRLLNVDNVSDGIENHLSQILTGQGKSIVLGLLSSVIALTGHNVEVVCYSNYLADRDQDAFRDFFIMFELNTRVNYKTFENLAFEFLNTSEGVSAYQITNDLILNKLEKQTSESVFSVKMSQKTFLLIDEVDVFFSDEFYGGTSNPCARVNIELLTDIQVKLWEIVNTRIYNSVMVLEKVNDFINQLKRHNKNGKVDQFVEFLSHSESIFNKQLKLMIDSAIKVAKRSLNKNSQFKINDDGRICFRQGNGIYCSRYYSGYRNIFHYFRLKETDFDHKNYSNFGYLQIGIGMISYAKVPLEYSVLLGVSGTLTTLNKPEKDAVKTYNINTISSMPSFFGRKKLIFDHQQQFIIEDTKASWLNQIFNNINAIIQSGRSVLVFFNEEDEILKFKAKFQSNINRLNIITGNEGKSVLESLINESGVAKTVTLGTRHMGRGVDYKSNDSSVEEKGGVHVIQTFFSIDVKEEIQIKGRTARKDNAGSYELILCREHLNKIKCNLNVTGNSINNYEELCVIRNKYAEVQGAKICQKIQQAHENHEKTIEYFKSLSNYKPENRNDYLTKLSYFN